MNGVFPGGAFSPTLAAGPALSPGWLSGKGRFNQLGRGALHRTGGTGCNLTPFIWGECPYLMPVPWKRVPERPPAPAPAGQAGSGSRCPAAAPGAGPAAQPRPAASPACGAVVNKGVRLCWAARPGPAPGARQRRGSALFVWTGTATSCKGDGSLQPFKFENKTGKKIPKPNQLENLTRGQSSSASGYPQPDPGLGLGIWICWGILSCLSGKLSIEPNIGVQSTDPCRVFGCHAQSLPSQSCMEDFLWLLAWIPRGEPPLSYVQCLCPARFWRSRRSAPGDTWAVLYVLWFGRGSLWGMENCRLSCCETNPWFENPISACLKHLVKINFPEWCLESDLEYHKVSHTSVVLWSPEREQAWFSTSCACFQSLQNIYLWTCEKKMCVPFQWKVGKAFSIGMVHPASSRAAFPWLLTSVRLSSSSGIASILLLQQQQGCVDTKGAG